CQHYYSTPYSL
nr:immunoglobulin light chain junction region [Macaca mulatta]